MPNSILPLLVCPVSKQNLFLLSGQKKERLHTALSNGALRYLDGTVLPQELERIQFLITENAQHLYSMLDDVPILLESKQIDMQGLEI